MEVLPLDVLHRPNVCVPVYSVVLRGIGELW